MGIAPLTDLEGQISEVERGIRTEIIYGKLPQNLIKWKKD